MLASPVRSLAVGVISLLTAVVATVGAMYEGPSTVVLRTDGAPAVEQTPVAQAPAPGPGQ